MIDFESTSLENEFDVHYGLLAPEQTVIVRAYSDDSDDRMLAEVQPKFIVMFEPNMEFIRRIEVCIYSRCLAFFGEFKLSYYCRCIRMLTLGWR